jgi:hypothetical protein
MVIIFNHDTVIPFPHSLGSNTTYSIATITTKPIYKNRKQYSTRQWPTILHGTEITHRKTTEFYKFKRKLDKFFNITTVNVKCK